MHRDSPSSAACRSRSAARTVAAMCAYVLVAEDDPKQAELVRRYLEREGHEVVGRARRAGRDRRGPAARPDLLVLDVMMPKVDGLDVCRVLRAESDLPMLMLTARSTEDDLLLGLDLGADDYMTKPYSPRELMARVRTLLRRSRQRAPATPTGGCCGSGDAGRRPGPARGHASTDTLVELHARRVPASSQTLAAEPGPGVHPGAAAGAHPRLRPRTSPNGPSTCT